jgi:transposase
MNPPAHALVLAVDEKSQIQALDRTAPCLPIRPATPARMTHDYVRHSTTSLFASYDAGSGPVIAQSCRRHRHQEFLRFLKLIDAAVPKDLDLHLALDNYATRKTPAIHQWLLKHPRFHLHFTPASSSWLNLAERWFAELTSRKPRRSARRSVTGLEADIRKWINERNKNPGPSPGPRPLMNPRDTRRLLPANPDLRASRQIRVFRYLAEPLGATDCPLPDRDDPIGREPGSEPDVRERGIPGGRPGPERDRDPVLRWRAAR